jgi:hypothetical protein
MRILEAEKERERERIVLVKLCCPLLAPHAVSKQYHNIRLNSHRNNGLPTQRLNVSCMHVECNELNIYYSKNI